MKLPWKWYCQNCGMNLKKEWWEYVSPERYNDKQRCKCPNCNKLNQVYVDGYMGDHWRVFDIINQYTKCNLCDFELLDNDILPKGCSHFAEEHI